MKYRKEFKDQVIKTRLYSLMSFDYEIADAYHISVATLKRWMKEFWAERNRGAENEEFSYNINWEKVSEI